MKAHIITLAEVGIASHRFALNEGDRQSGRGSG
jgi:hypothetical protein